MKYARNFGHSTMMKRGIEDDDKDSKKTSKKIQLDLIHPNTSDHIPVSNLTGGDVGLLKCVIMIL